MSETDEFTQADLDQNKEIDEIEHVELDDKARITSLEKALLDLDKRVDNLDMESSHRIGSLLTRVNKLDPLTTLIEIVEDIKRVVGRWKNG